MALITSHTLNGTDGTHAGNIAVRLVASNETRAPLFENCTDDGGRLSEVVDATTIDSTILYDLIFVTGPYWSTSGTSVKPSQINDEIVIRFRMSDPDGHYHMPIIFNPNSYSIWISGEE
jgi:5-hydroxyisourate hydrolase